MRGKEKGQAPNLSINPCQTPGQRPHLVCAGKAWGLGAEGRQTPERHLSLEGIAALAGILGGCCFLKGRHFLSQHTAPAAELLVGGEDEVSGGFLRSKESRETI